MINMINMINMALNLPTSNLDAINRDAWDGDGYEAFLLDLQVNCCSNWDRLVQSYLYREGDWLPGSDHQREGLHIDVVQGNDVLIGSIWSDKDIGLLLTLFARELLITTKSNFQFIKLEVSGRGHGWTGEEREEYLHGEVMLMFLLTL